MQDALLQEVTLLLRSHVPEFNELRAPYRIVVGGRNPFLSHTHLGGNRELPPEEVVLLGKVGRMVASEHMTHFVDQLSQYEPFCVVDDLLVVVDPQMGRKRGLLDAVPQRIIMVDPL
jgi:hypothetical protein